jgi:glyoxylase-like metal-dependent hydrolase (beta-lactamase superfamily II)
MTETPEPPSIRAFFDPATNTVSYLVWDPATRQAAAIDPVLDFDPASGEVDVRSVQALLSAVQEQGVSLAWVLETHIHADHLSGAPLLRQRTGARIGIGARVDRVRHLFRPMFRSVDDGTFDALFEDGARFPLGRQQVQVLHTPGHTPACVAYVIGDTAFVGDTLFMPDYGTARCDFPGGDARQLYRSIRRILDLPPTTRLFMCHDYKAPGRDSFAWETTVAAQRAHNVHVHDGVTEDAFVAMRTARDATLSAPRLLLPSIQVNINAGRFPEAAANGVRYLMIPVRPRAGAEGAIT